MKKIILFIVAILFISCSNNDLDINNINPYVETKTYGPVIEQIPLEQYTVITYITRTYIVDTDIHKNGDIQRLQGMELCPFKLVKDTNNIEYIYVFYDGNWHKTRFYKK